MAEAHGSIDVDVRVRDVFHQWTEVETFPHFMTGVESITKIDTGRTHWVMRIAGVVREFDAEITDQAEDSHIAWQSIGELTQGGRVEFTPTGPSSTRVTLTVHWDPDGFTEKVGAAVGVDSATVRMDLERFKRYIESQS